MADYVDLKMNVGGKTQSVKIEKGCSFSKKNKVYTAENNGKISVLNKETGKKEITNSVKMTNYQFATFKAMANNTNEGTGKLTFSKADIDSAMNKFSKGGFVKDISEFLAKGYKILNPKKFTEENKLSVYVSSGKEKTSGVMSFQAADKVSSTSKTQETNPSSSVSHSSNTLFNNKNIVTHKAFSYTVKKGDSLVDLARKYELDTYQIVAANPQLKNGRDYTVKFRKNNLAIIDSKLKAGTKITIPARYTVKKGSVKNLNDVAKITGISKNYLNDLLTVTEVSPKHPGKPDLRTYDDGFGMPTIGFGHTGKVDGKRLSLKNRINISYSKACELLAEDILKHEAMVASYVGASNYRNAPASVKAAIMDNAYNKGIWDGFLSPYANKYTKNVKKNLADGHYATALCNTRRITPSSELKRRNVYRFISGLTDLPRSKQKAAIKAYKPYYNQVVKSQKGLDKKYLQQAWHDAERGDTINYRMKAAQTNR